MSLADVDVVDVEGKPHKLGELWKTQPALLHFVRHFG
jgi:hypothetical protein